MVLKVSGLKKSYRQGSHLVEALRGVDVEIKKGEFVCVMGPSGSGKSTFLQIVGALDRPTEGQVVFKERDIAKFTDAELSSFRRTQLGFVFQFFNLMPTLSALENVALPLILDGRSLSSVEARARELLTLMGLGDRAGHKPHELSGGQMQRVAIARALLAEPLLLLADEPTGNLDTKTGTAVLELLQKLAREQGQTIVMVTHDPKAAQYGSRKIVLQDGLVIEDRAMGD